MSTEHTPGPPVDAWLSDLQELVNDIAAGNFPGDADALRTITMNDMKRNDMKLSQRIRVDQQYSAKATYSWLRRCVKMGAKFSRRECIAAIIWLYGWNEYRPKNKPRLAR